MRGPSESCFLLLLQHGRLYDNTRNVDEIPTRWKLWGNVHGHRTRGNIKTIPTSTRYNSTNMDQVQAAIEAYESQELGEQLSVQEVADNYSVWRSTMQRRMDGQLVPRAEHTTNTRKLSPQQEDELVLYIRSLTARRLPPTRAMVQNFASEIARERVSERWVSRFLIRHNDSLTPR
jgi:hypothetical protein